MRRFAWTRWFLAVSAIAVGGCAESPMVLKGQLNRVQQERLALSRQIQELQGRADTLDADNQELQTLLARTERQNQVLNDQVAVLREQLGGITSQLARVQEEKKTTDQRAQALTASMRRRGGVTIEPNNSFLSTLPQFNQPDVHVRRDGDVIRIELPGHLLFQQGSAQILPAGVPLIAAVAAELAQAYPNQMIGVEGHSDTDPVRNALWRSNTQLSVGRAMAVQEILVSQTPLRPEQLFVVGHGPNHPVVSNATPAGKQRNQRVELVVYPEKRG